MDELCITPPRDGQACRASLSSHTALTHPPPCRRRRCRGLSRIDHGVLRPGQKRFISSATHCWWIPGMGRRTLQHGDQNPYWHMHWQSLNYRFLLDLLVFNYCLPMTMIVFYLLSVQILAGHSHLAREDYLNKWPI